MEPRCMKMLVLTEKRKLEPNMSLSHKNMTWNQKIKKMFIVLLDT